MTATNLLKYWYLLAIGILIALLCFQGCYDKHKATTDFVAAVNYQDSATYYKLKSGEAVATNEALVLSNSQQLIALTSKDKQLAEIESKFKSIQAVIRIKEVMSIFHDTVVVHDGKFKQDTDLIDLFGSVDTAHLIIDSLHIKNVQSIVVGEKKTGLLSSKTTVDVINSNPSIKSNAIQGYIVHETKWYENSKTQFIAGCLVGGVLVGIIR